MSVVLMLREVAHFGYFREWIPSSPKWKQMNIFFSFISSNSPSFFAPSPPPAKFNVKIRQTKMERSGLQIIFFQFRCLIPVTNRLYLGWKKGKPIHVWQFWCLSHISKILNWKSNKNNNHSLMNTISILVYRKIESRQDFTTKKVTLQ